MIRPRYLLPRLQAQTGNSHINKTNTQPNQKTNCWQTIEISAD
jgi:hypothetical protein